MTTETVSQDTTVQTPPPAVVPVADPPKLHVAATDLPPDALKARLDQAKQAGQAELLRSLGVTDPEQIKTALAAAKAAEDAKKTDSERATAQALELQRAQAAIAENTKALGLYWDAESAKLTAEQLQAVTELAGDDPGRRLSTLTTLRKTWGLAPAAAPPNGAQQPPAAPPAPTPAPANTSASQGGPAAAQTSPTDHKAVFQQLQQTNPIAAARYASAHAQAIWPEPK